MVPALYLSAFLCLTGPAICRGVRDATWRSSIGGGGDQASALSLLDDLVDSHTRSTRKLLQNPLSTFTEDTTAPDAGRRPNDVLLLGAGLGDVTLIEMGLSAGADVDVRNEEGNTGLYLASLQKHHDAMEALIDAGADVDASQDGLQAIHAAAINPDNAEGLSILVDAGADVNAVAPGSRLTPLAVAASHGHVSNIRFLIAEGADFDSSFMQSLVCSCLTMPTNHLCNYDGCRNDKISIQALFD